MRLDQFDKLDQNINKTIKFILDLKIENNRLKKEVALLKKQLETTSERGIKESNSRQENRLVTETFPGEKSETLVSQLDEVIKKMKSFTTGVEF